MTTALDSRSKVLVTLPLLSRVLDAARDPRRPAPFPTYSLFVAVERSGVERLLRDLRPLAVERAPGVGHAHDTAEQRVDRRDEVDVAVSPVRERESLDVAVRRVPGVEPGPVRGVDRPQPAVDVADVQPVPAEDRAAVDVAEGRLGPAHPYCRASEGGPSLRHHSEWSWPGTRRNTPGRGRSPPSPCRSPRRAPRARADRRPSGSSRSPPRCRGRGRRSGCPRLGASPRECSPRRRRRRRRSRRVPPPPPTRSASARGSRPSSRRSRGPSRRASSRRRASPRQTGRSGSGTAPASRG